MTTIKERRKIIEENKKAIKDTEFMIELLKKRLQGEKQDNQIKKT